MIWKHKWAYLGIISDYSGSYSDTEVDHVFSVPLSWLLQHEPMCYKTTLQTVPGEEFPFEMIPGGREYPWKKGHDEVYFYQVGGEIIWGMTAKILYAFVNLYKKEIR